MFRGGGAPVVMAAAACWLSTVVSAFDYELVGMESISATDVATLIPDLKTIFTDQQTYISVGGLIWEPTTGPDDDGDMYIEWKTLVNGELQAQGNVSLADVDRELPNGFDAGIISINHAKRSTIEVVATLSGTESSVSQEFEVYMPGVAIIPLVVIFVFAVVTHMVEFSLISGIFVGACIIMGNVKDGFMATLDTYLVSALTNEGHVMVILFSLFLSGMVGMMQRSGGMLGMTQVAAKFATTARRGGLVAMGVGIIIFFDDYANLLLSGESMRPLMDMLHVSREKLSFIVDATSAPIASVSPVSSWVGFEAGLIQGEIDRLAVLYGGVENLTIVPSGFGVFLETIRYRYYPWFMLIFMFISIILQKDFGPMLIAERKTHVYKRTDGGDAANLTNNIGIENPNAPKEGQPLWWWNMIIPVVLLVFFIFYLLVMSGTSGEPGQSFLDKIQNSDSYVALLYGTMAAALCTLLLYHVQIHINGRWAWPTPQVLKELSWFKSKPSENDDDGMADEPVIRPQVVMDVKDSIDTFIRGMVHLFPAIIVLTLAWASGSIMVDVGADRLFASWIVGGVDPRALPTLSFVISFLMALATGTSWGTMSILFPLLLVPTYMATDADANLFYGTTAGILAGSVAGDHVSPISDTTVLASLSCDCQLLRHVATQSPYVAFIVLCSILFGTIPMGWGAWPNWAGYIVGIVIIFAVCLFYGKPIINNNGSFDLITELIQMIGRDHEMEKLRLDTADAAAGKDVSITKETEHGGEEVVFEAKKLVEEGEAAPPEQPPSKEEEAAAPEQSAVLDDDPVKEQSSVLLVSA